MTIKDAIFGVQSPQKRAAASDDLQGSLPIADIDRGIIHTRDGGLVGLFEVLPMNFFLQSTAERVRIVWPHGSKSRRAAYSFSACHSRSMWSSTRAV